MKRVLEFIAILVLTMSIVALFYVDHARADGESNVSNASIF